jgi:hypothetical protein
MSRYIFTYTYSMSNIPMGTEMLVLSLIRTVDIYFSKIYAITPPRWSKKKDRSCNFPNKVISPNKLDAYLILISN